MTGTTPAPRPGQPDAAIARALDDAPQESARPARRRIFVRGPWEMAASILIGIGVVMLMQPVFLWAYTWSFLVTLVGTVMFIIVSHFPE